MQKIHFAYRFYKALFRWQVRSILATPPLKPGTEDFIALSMVQHRDVLPYLLSIKSFARYLQPARVVIVADPTLNADDRALIKGHVPHIEFREAADFQRDGIPIGGCWERLSAIAVYAQNTYVVQLDADTVALTDMPEVRRAIRDRVAFMLPTEDKLSIIPCSEIAEWAKPRLTGRDHIQLLAEASLDRFDTAGHMRYARGCAGFSGFGPGNISSEQMMDISRRMAGLIGDVWWAWGSEQFASNLIVSNSPGARLLPYPNYCNADRYAPATVFLHFIGYARFTSRLYGKLARSISRELAQSTNG